MKTLNTMKHLFIFIALCLLAVAAMAQQNIRVSYDQTEFRDIQLMASNALRENG